jgi:hypothetical protein
MVRKKGMKKIALIIFLIVSTIMTYGQPIDYGFKNSTWKSDAYLNDSIIRHAEEIGLGRMNNPKDSLKINVTIWNFNEGLLTISYYDCNIRKDSLIITYKYEVEQGILKIIDNNNEIIKYNVGFISTGSFALLMRTKEKKKK